MEFGTINTASIVGMIFSLIVAFALPISLLLIGKIKYKAQISSFFIGCGVFLVMALIIESSFHSIVFKFAGDTLLENTLLYALYGATAAAIFEETGRFLAFKFFLKNNFNIENTFMYGFGHGGFEAIAILGLTSINNIANSIMINAGAMPSVLQLLDEDTATQTYTALEALWTTPSYMFFLGGVERIFAILLQVSFSLLIYSGIKLSKNIYIALAFLTHFLVDFVSVILSKSVNATVLEIIVAILAIVIFIFAHSIIKKAEA